MSTAPRDPDSIARGLYAENVAYRVALTEVAEELERLFVACGARG